MDNQLMKELIQKMDTILLEKADAVVINYKPSNINEALYLKKLLETSPLFKKYASRNIGVIMLPEELNVKVHFANDDKKFNGLFVCPVCNLSSYDGEAVYKHMEDEHKDKNIGVN